MRRTSLAMILGAACALVFAVLTIWFLAGNLSATGHYASSVVVDIADRPAVVAVLPEPPPAAAPAPPPVVAAPPPPPPNAFIVETIREKLKDPELRKGADADDLAALEAYYAERTGPSLWMTEQGFSEKAQAVIDELGKADEWGLVSEAFTVPSAGTSPSSKDAQAKAEIELDLAILKYARFAKGGRSTPAELSKIIDQTPVPADPKIVITEIAAADTPGDYLKSLHPKHEQFHKLREELLEAREAGAKPADIELLLINMERWRWMPGDLGARYVQINVPEFMAFYVKDGKTAHEEKVVVGKLVYATPVFSADMTSIVFNPEWTVPPTVIKEDLLPHLRKGGGWFSSSSNTAVLKQHRLKVKYKGRTVDPDKIDWKKVNMAAISFHQPPGPKNVLGKVKFLYPNEHAVYMHDTIKKGLMDKEVRVEGHHCPRVANPGKFAAILLADDQNMPQAEIDKLLATGNDSEVELKTPIPVHTTYFTAVVGSDGKVKTFGDVYKLDAVVKKALGDDLKAQSSVTEAAAPKTGTVADSTP